MCSVQKVMDTVDKKFCSYEDVLAKFHLWTIIIYQLIIDWQNDGSSNFKH